MDNALERKLTSLRKRIRKLDSALVAFSGGVDSTFLMRICREELGEKAVAVTALSDHYPSTELSLARRIARIIGAKHIVLNPNPQEPLPHESPNGGRKGSNVYSSLKSLAMRMKIGNVLDGSHKDDAHERGKSFMAAKKAGVRSPLLETDLTKAEIRLLAKELGLPNWDKPASSKSKAKSGPKAKPAVRVDAARTFMESLNFSAKVKAEGNRALIIVGRKEMALLARRFASIRKKLRSLGFSEVLLKLDA